MATKTRKQTIRFLSANTGLRMQRQTQGEKTLNNGNTMRDPAQPEVTYEFDRGALELTVGQDMMLDKIDPETGELVEQDAVEWIRSTPEYATRIIEVEPVAPDPAIVLAQVGPLAAAGDVEGLTALGDAEHGSWNRAEVLDVISASLDAIQTKAPAKA